MNFFKSIFKDGPAKSLAAEGAKSAEAESAKGAVEGGFGGSTQDEKDIYLDYASVTPVDPAVLAKMHEASREFYANPSSLYSAGVRSSKKLEEARGAAARCLEVHANELYFTSGGTESNNLAIRGFFSAVISNVYFKPHIVTSTIEHPSVLEVLKDMGRSGMCDITYVPVTEDGIVDLKELKSALRRETALVTIQYANNEIGTLQPIHEIAKAIRHHRKNKSEVGGEGSSPEEIFEKTLPAFHTDACQAPAYCSLRVPSLGVDMMTLDSSKFYGPRGTGVLFAKKGIKLRPLLFGGAQEEYVRPGTEPVANIVGFAEALELCQKDREAESARVGELRDGLLSHLLEQVPSLKVNGSMKERLPNNINVCLENMDAEFAVIRLDAKGVFVSSVTSCKSKKEDSSSYVVEALSASVEGQKNKKNCSKSSLRITLGKHTTKDEVERAKMIISQVLTTML